jgi:hypothetical protein
MRSQSSVGEAWPKRSFTVGHELGVKRLVLETGVYQAEAIALYRSAGYRPIRCWGEYAEALTSVCFEKVLS